MSLCSNKKLLPFFAEELEPPQILGPMSSTNQENYTVSLGGQTTLQCAVRSLGPTQIQWLKQLHDHQAPTDRNRTIVVFDFIFEVIFLAISQLGQRLFGYFTFGTDTFGTKTFWPKKFWPK